MTRHAYAALSEEAKGLRKTISGIFSTEIALSLSYLAFMAILAKYIMGLLWRRIPYATSHSREKLLSGLEIKKYKYVCQNITKKTPVSSNLFLSNKSFHRFEQHIIFKLMTYCSPNRPIPSSPRLLFQNEGRCSAFDMEVIIHSHTNKTHFHKKGCAPSLILKVRVFGTRKWPIPFP